MFMSYRQLNEELKRDLDYKIDTAVNAIREGFSVCKHNASIAFSGGKDSTVLWDLIRRFFPQEAGRIYSIFGNTGVEYPESLKFARQLGREWGGERFYEATPLKTERPSFKYEAQCQILEWLIQEGRVDEVLQQDGKLKSTDTLEAICPEHLKRAFEEKNLIWRAGTTKSYWWCVDQYGWPLLGKAFSRLKAHRINIDCFLRFSQSTSQDPKTLAYYDVLREVKISQACCDILKKEPSEALQAELDVDVIFKGLMASESRTRATNFLTRGYLFRSGRPHLGEAPFYHCNPLSIWTDEDIWAYIKRFDVPYSPLYDLGWKDADGEYHRIERNGCMGCGTDLLYANNHMAMLRRTHPQPWKIFMKRGMAGEIQKLQQLKRGGQLSMMDFMKAEALLEIKPCAFDRIDRLVMDEMTMDAGMMEYDPDAEE